MASSTLYSYISVLFLLYISSSNSERIVDKPPRIITEPEKSWGCKECDMGDRVIVYFKEGERAELTCHADGRPMPEYEWRKDGRVINFDDPSYISVKTNKTRVIQQGGIGTLDFSETIESDIGIYQCFAKNKLGTALSLKIDLKQAKNTPFDTLTKPEVKSVLYGSPLTLSCKPKLSIPKASVFWTADSGEVSEEFRRIEQSERVIMDYLGNLHFANLKKSDEQNGQPYVCNTYHKIFRSYTKGEDKIISGIGANAEDVFKEPPSVLWRSSVNVLGLLGEEAKFMCIFGGKPTPTITWSRIGGKLDIPRMNISKFGHELKITKVDGSDEGQYECVGRNAHDEKRVTFTLRVDSKPYWMNTPQDQQVGVEESASFQCLAQGKPKPTVQWFLNGKPIQDVNLDPKRIQLSNNQLTYSDLKKEDTTVIQCLANNTHGALWADFYLNVLALVPEITSEPGEKKVAEGQSVTMRCENNGKPNPTLQWWRATDTPQLLDGPRYHTSGDSITIKEVTTSDEGAYECRAENKLGTARGSGLLTVRKATRIVKSPSGGLVMFDLPFIFQCVAKTDKREKDNLFIYWLKDGVRIDPATDSNMKVSKNQLEILKTSSAYSGNYTCVAGNNIDETFETTELEVEAPPDPPTLKLYDCGQKSARLQWHGARANYRDIKKYIIEKKMFFETETEWEIIAETAADVSDIKLTLSPYVNYTFQIKAENDLGPGRPSARTTTCLTQVAKPDHHPKNVKTIEDTTNFLIIEWDQMPPEEHNAPGFKYIIEVNKQGSSKKQKYVIEDYRETTKRIQTNDTYQPYEIYVHAVNSQGDPLSPPFTNMGHSGMAPPVVVPKNFELDPDVNITYKLAGFRWDKVIDSPENIRGKFTGYEIRYWRANDPEQIKKIVKVHSDAHSGRRRRRQAEDKVKAIIENLPAYTALQLDVVVTNTYFSSNGSEVLNLSTPEGVPGPVRNLRAESRGVYHLKISWREPERPNGEIKGYHVTYEEIYGVDIGDKKKSNGEINELYGGRFITIINGLKERMNYRVHVQAHTEPGIGEDIYIDVVTASPGDPAVPIISDIARDFDSLNVSWSLDTNHERAGYQHFVEYRKQGDSDFIKMPPETLLNWQVVPNLTSGMVFEVRVVAKSGESIKRSGIRSVATKGPTGQVAMAVYEHTWFIIMMISLAILILIFIIVCLVKRSRGDKYHVQEKEKLRGLDPDEKKSAHINEFNDNGEKQPLAGGSDPDLEKAGLDSEQDSLEEYGDVDPSRFNEDGSFIGQYGAQNTTDTNQPSAMHTFV